MHWIRQIYFHVMYYASWLAFGLVGLLLNVGCAPFLLLPRTAAQRRRTRRVIRWLFQSWQSWFHATGVLRVHWIGHIPPLPKGAVYVANHPTLLDATLLLARMPAAFCIFKPALMRNPAIAPAAILAGYEAGAFNVDTIRQAAAKVALGESLLVFPEGTRTEVGQRLGVFRPGFALIATRAGAPVQSFLIRSSPGLVRRGCAWWKPPAQLPAWLEIEVSHQWPHDPARSAAELAADVRRHFESALGATVQ